MGLFDSIRNVFTHRGGDDRASLSRKVQSSPNDPQARQKLGIFLMQQGEVVEGLDQLARSAVLYEKDGFSVKAIAVLRQMLRHDPGNNDFQKWLIRLLAQEGLAADAQAELRKAASDPARFSSDDHRIDFLRQTAGYLPDSPLPRLLIFDVLRGQKKLLEAAGELQKAVGPARAAGMAAEFTERLRSLAAQGSDEPGVLESCGFLWLAFGVPEEGMPLLDRVAESEAGDADPARAETVRKVIEAIRGGWNVEEEAVFSFAEADRKLAGGGPAEPPASPAPQEPATSVPGREPARAGGTAEEGYAEEESIVRNALGRLQAKVQEEIGDTDLDARYNLGIAYKEMGLLEDAAKEFRISMSKPELRVGAVSMLADTIADQGDLEGAIAEIDTALSEGDLSAQERRDLRYHKAILLSRCGKGAQARIIFREIQEESPGYRDVAERSGAGSEE